MRRAYSSTRGSSASRSRARRDARRGRRGCRRGRRRARGRRRPRRGGRGHGARRGRDRQAAATRRAASTRSAALGGSGGSALVTHAMRELPIGVPKLMVSTIASGDTQPVRRLGRRHDDVLGRRHRRPEPRCRRGSWRTLRARSPGWRARPCRGSARSGRSSAASMFGVTTPAVTVARERLEELGYEVLVFHQTGAGRRLDGEAPRGGVRRRLARRHDDRVLRRGRRRGARGGPRAARVGREGRHPAGRVARRARHGQLRPDRTGPAAVSRPRTSTSTTRRSR